MSGRHGMPRGFFLHDTIEANGKTIRENNLAKTHGIPLHTLVEVKCDTWFGDGACEKVHARLWVVGHKRDCDGTPLYSLSRWRDPREKGERHGFGEESLTPVKVDDRLQEGYGALEWDEED